MSKIEYLICQFYIITSLFVWNGKLRNNTDVTLTLQAIMKYVSRPKSAAVEDIDIDVDINISDIFGRKYWYRIDISKGDIDPPLIVTHS